MKKKLLIRAIALLLAFMMILGVVISAVVAFAEPVQAARNAYHLDIYLHEDEQAAEVSQRLTYTNQTGEPLSFVVFHLYPNAYRRSTTLPFEDAALTDAFPDEYAPGGVDFVSISVNDAAADWGVSGDSEQFLRVSCALAPGETAVFGFDYYVLMPLCRGKFGAGDLSIRLTDFYPIVAVYDPIMEDFSVDPIGAVGEPYYGEAADYSVSLNAPETYRVAATGDQTAGEPQNGRITWTIRAQAARDLAIVLSRKYTEYAAATASGATVRVLSNNASDAQAALSAAVDAMNLFSEWFGDYPYAELDIAHTEYLLSGASYPGLIELGEEMLRAGNRDALRREVVNQVAHQWFSGIVGNNQADEPWLDEAVCSIVTLMYTEQREGYDAYLAALNEQVLASLQLTLPGGLSVDSPIARFTERSEYQIAVIDRGAAVMHELRGAMGRDAFLAALKLYAQQNWLKNASIADFAAALNEASSGEWDAFLVNQMYSIGDYANQDMDWYE